MSVKYSDLPELNFLKSPDISVDEEGNMVWMNGKKPADRDEALIQIIEQLNEYLAEWDHQDINRLWDLIVDIEAAAGEMSHPMKLGEAIALSSLPSEDIPSGMETYPIWSMDKYGRCLVGAGQLAIEPLKDIRDWYVYRKPEYCSQPEVKACYLCSLRNYTRDCHNYRVFYPSEEEE